MSFNNLQDDELGASEVLWSPDLDARWRLLRRHITPFEKDRSAYHSAKYQKPVFVFMNPVIWRRLVEKQGAYRAVDLMLILGFVPAPEDSSSISEWMERDAAVAARGAATTTTIPTAETTALTSPSAGVTSAGGGQIASRKLLGVCSCADEDLRQSVGVRFRVLNNEESRPLTCLTSAPQNTSPLSSVFSPLGSSSTMTTSHATLSLTAAAGANTSATNTAANTNTNAVVVVGARSETDSASVGIRNLETEVKELRRQIRLLKLREGDRDGSVASDVASQHETPQPHIIIHPDRPLVAFTTCHSLVCLPVNYLDPDCAPYVVSLGASTGRKLLACTIVEHRYVFFLAPPHRRGSLAVVLLCTKDATLQPYTRAVWLEYMPQDPPNTLTHHAVNQLLQEIPLPSSATVADPNPSEMEQMKSESAFDDDNTFCDTDTAISTLDHGLESESRLPLTKEMLELIPNGVITGVRMGRPLAADQITGNNGEFSVVGSEYSLGGTGQVRVVAADMSWNDNDETKLDSTAMSTGFPTSYQCGQQSCFSDEEITQHAFNYTTNHTEISSSAATSVMSIDSGRQSNIFGLASIMARRGWVRRFLPGTPTNSQCFSVSACVSSSWQNESL